MCSVTRQLATTYFMTMLLVCTGPPSARADDRLSRATLKGISAVYVVVEDLPSNAATLGLSRDTIQTDVELKLRLAGMAVLTEEEGIKPLGAAHIYVNVNFTDPAVAASIKVALDQNALLERNGEFAIAVTTWDTNYVIANPTAQGIRNVIKDGVDQFLNAWLSVNPKK